MQSRKLRAQLRTAYSVWAATPSGQVHLSGPSLTALFVFPERSYL